MAVWVLAKIFDDFTWGEEVFVKISDDIIIEPGDSLSAYAIRQATIDGLSRMMVDIGHPDGDTEHISREGYELVWVFDEEETVPDPDERQFLCHVFICEESEYHQMFEDARAPRQIGRMEWVKRDENSPRCDCEFCQPPSVDEDR
jgi:hypothetical protein